MLSQNTLSKISVRTCSKFRRMVVSWTVRRQSCAQPRYACHGDEGVARAEDGFCSFRCVVLLSCGTYSQVVDLRYPCIRLLYNVPDIFFVLAIPFSYSVVFLSIRFIALLLCSSLLRFCQTGSARQMAE